MPLTPNECRIGVTGSRNWRQYGLIQYALWDRVLKVREKNLSPVLVHGGCPTGADAIADEVWRRWGWEPLVFPADWDSCGRDCPSDFGRHRKVKKANDRHHPGSLVTFCPKAGPRRNRLMVGSGLDILLAFPLNGPMRGGTWQCVNTARGAKVEVVFPEWP